MDILKSENNGQMNVAIEKLDTLKVSESLISVELSNVSLCYKRKAVFFLSKQKQLRREKAFWALQDISFSISEGETIGIIGRNGSGKSTISRVISGSLIPDEGFCNARGRVQLLALGIGFRPGLTGRENVMISGCILGLTRRQVKEKMANIEDFAELGDFFDEPLSTYSAGMRSRLGFAVSTAVEPDILILDEVMSTGDAAFRQKANERMKQMRERTKTVIIVSHSPSQVKEMCSRVIWLEKSRLLLDGTVDEVLPKYQKFCKAPQKWLKENGYLMQS